MAEASVIGSLIPSPKAYPEGWSYGEFSDSDSYTSDSPLEDSGGGRIQEKKTGSSNPQTTTDASNVHMVGTMDLLRIP